MSFKVCNRRVQKANVGSNVKATTLYHKVLLRVISVMNIVPHSIAPLKVVDHILQQESECTIKLPCFQFFLSSSNFLNIVSNYEQQYAQFCDLAFKFPQQFQLQEHRVK